MDPNYRARAALSAPEQGPTDEEIMELMPRQLWADLATVSRLAAHGAGPDVGPGLFRVTLNAGIVEHCRAVLARWGRPAVEQGPEQVPTEAEVADLAENLEYQRLPQDTSTGPSFLLEFAHAVLARWGRPAVEPVPQEGADG